MYEVIGCSNRRLVREDFGCRCTSSVRLGFANLIADGISMGLGDYLSDCTEHDYAGNEQRIAKWECKNDLHAQAVGTVQVYEDAEERC